MTTRTVEPNKSRPLIMGVVLLVAAVEIVFIVGAIRDPTLSLHGLLGSMVWSTFGPHLVLLSLVALGLAVLRLRRGRGRLASLASTLSVVAFLGSTYITARIVSAARTAGGSVNPASGLVLKSMNAGGPDESVVFRTVDSQALHAAVYRPAGTTRTAPVLVYVHGGGFLTGSNIETDADLRWFSDQGWLVFSVEYRLFTPDTATWDKASEDVACAVAWVGANAATYGGDTSRVAILGDSAGGNLAINVSYAAALGDVPFDCGAVPVPAAVVVQYPAVDPVAIYEDGYPVPGFEPKMLVSGYLGGNPDQLPDRVRAVSSYTYISNRAPHTLILAPEKDSIVPSRSVYRFADQAELAGVDVELVRIPFSNHVYNQLASQSIGNQARLTITRRYLIDRGLGPEPAEQL